MAIKVYPLISKKSITIYCVYKPPSTKAVFKQEFYSLISHLSLCSTSLIVVDDFNIDLLKNDSDNDIFGIYGLFLLIKSATRVTVTSSILKVHIYSLSGVSTYLGVLQIMCTFLLHFFASVYCQI